MKEIQEGSNQILSFDQPQSKKGLTKNLDFQNLYSKRIN